MNFIKSTLSSLSISPSLVTPEPDTKKPTAATLFPQVDPAVDGPDCRRDCASCTTHYPKNFDIDIQDRLFGNVDGWSTHVLVATGKTDWVRDVADEAGSMMEALSKQGPDGGEIPVTNGVSDCLLACLFVFLMMVESALSRLNRTAAEFELN